MRRYIPWLDNWRFRLDAPELFWRADFDDSDWRAVRLPHDWAVEGDFAVTNSSGTGYLPGGYGAYRGRLHLDDAGIRAALVAGARVFLLCEGIHKRATLWLNGSQIGYNANGYTSFHIDITRYLHTDGRENVLAVLARHPDLADSRWYTGSGITRPIGLLLVPGTHFAIHGVYMNTLVLEADGSARLHLHAELDFDPGAAAADCRVCWRLLDAAGREVLAVTRSLPAPGAPITCEATVAEPRLWSPATPQRYTLVAELLHENRILDRVTQLVGIREARFTPDRGFLLNGRPFKLNGVCVHHDAGCFGAAVPRAVWARRLTILRDIGVNAIRMSHNPHDTNLMELCDELGFLAIAEAFDEWEGTKNKWSTGHNVYPPVLGGYAEDWYAWHEFDLTALVRRDRRHPCVIAWSIGNEIDYPNDPYVHPAMAEATGNNDANKPAQERVYNSARPDASLLVPIARRLRDRVRRLDPTRPVTAAISYPEVSTLTGLCEVLDVVGYNYKEQFYDRDHERFPHWCLLGSENAKSLAAFRASDKRDFIAGQFLWTGIDFLGETAGWPLHGSSAGLLDLAGFEKPVCRLRRVLWDPRPVLAVYAITPGEDPEDWRHAEDLRESLPPFSGAKTVELAVMTNLVSRGATLEVYGCGADGCREGAALARITGETVPTEEGWYRLTLTRATAGLMTAAVSAEGESMAETTIHAVQAPVALRVCELDPAEDYRPVELTQRSAAAIPVQPEARLAAFCGTLPWNSAGSAARPDNGEPRLRQLLVEAVDVAGRRVETANALVRVAAGEGLVLRGLENGQLADTTPYRLPQRRLERGRLLVFVEDWGEGRRQLALSVTGLAHVVVDLACPGRV